MNVSLPVKCASCGQTSSQTIRIDDTSFDWTCVSCGHVHPTFLSLELTIGFLLLERSRAELQEKDDYALSITLAACAFEIELSRLFIKWTHIADLGAGHDFNRQKCEAQLKTLRFVPKLEAVANMLYSKGLEGFVQDSPTLKATITTSFPSLHIGSLAKDFHETVFKPRNAIVHQGDLQYTKQDAERTYSFACLGLKIFRDMDLERRKLL